MMDDELLRPAVAHLASDGFIAYPTETVWGLGACADRPQAVEKLMEWKGRGEDAPMSLLVHSLEAGLDLGCLFDEPAMRLAKAFWPGPLTLVVPCTRRVSGGTQRDDAAIGLRCSSHPIAHALAVAVDSAGLGPLTSTSMNRSGEPPARDLAAARGLVPGDGLAGDAAEPMLVCDPARDAGGGMPSSVVDCTDATPTILRTGAIASERLRDVWSRVESPVTREMAR
jgi:L-threonylcarbamoyladenylate synthase